MNWLLLFGFGAVGVAGRYFIWSHFQNVGGFPLGTLLVNVIGSGLIGLFYNLGQGQSLPWLNQSLLLAITLGLLGSLTTFSSFSLETIRLYETQGWVWALSNVLANNLLCFVFCLIGMRVAAP